MLWTKVQDALGSDWDYFFRWNITSIQHGGDAVIINT